MCERGRKGEGGRERERVKRRDDDYLATERTTTTMTSIEENETHEPDE